MDANTKPDAPATPLSWGFLIFPGFPMACLTSAIEPLRAANELTGERIFSWRILAEEDDPVRSSADIRFAVDQHAWTIGQVDAIMLISPPSARFRDRLAASRLRWRARHGTVLGAFSGGVFPLARTGLLRGATASIHWAYEAAFAAEFPDLPTTRAAIHRQGRLVTASGAGAVFDLMLRVIEERLGRRRMNEVACWFNHPFVRHLDARQNVPVPGGTEDLLPLPVREAVRHFRTHIEDPISIADVASFVGLSERTLERAFKSALGESPLRYYRRMRLDHARQRVLYSTDSLSEIARSVGYAEPADMARHYAEAFGRRPQEERRRVAGLRGMTGEALPDL